MNVKHQVSLKVIRILLAICEDASPEAHDDRDLGLLEWTVDVVTQTRNWAGVAALNRKFDGLLAEVKSLKRKKRLQQLTNTIVQDFTLPTKYQRKRKALAYLELYRNVVKYWSTDVGPSKKARELYQWLEELEAAHTKGSG